MRDQLSKTYKHDKAENKFYSLGERLAEVSYEDPESLESAAQALNLEIKQTGLFTRETGEEIASESKIREMAFSEGVLGGNNSDPVEIGDNKVVIINIKEHRLPTTKSLDEVKGEIIASLKLDLAKKKTKDQGDEIFRKLKNGIAIKDTVSQDGALAINSKRISQLEKGFPREITKAVFKAPKPVDGHPTPLQVELSGGGQAIINLLSVHSAKAENIVEKDRNTVKNVLTQGSGVSLFSAMVSRGREDVGVRFIASEE